MTKNKTRLDKSLDAIAEKAEFCSDLAKGQRATADMQHQSAHKLEKLSEALTEDVANVKKEVEAKEKVKPRSSAVDSVEQKFAH